MSQSRPVVAFIWDGADAAQWRSRMADVLGDFDMRVYPDIGDPADIDYAMVWMPPPGELARYANLKAIFSIAAGVTHITRDPGWPRHVPVVRLTDEVLSLDMACHAIHWVLHFHRGYGQCRADQANKIWRRPVYPPNAQCRVGVLGMGTIGQTVARHLRGLGFDVAGWSRSPKQIDGVASYFGNDQLPAFLAGARILVSVLPPTPETANLLDARALGLLPEGASFINMGRGEVVDDAALLRLLDSGRIANAALDVFRVEPLPEDSPYWTHPRVYVTPHAAGPTGIEYGARRIAENIKLMLAGGMPDSVMDPDKGY